jgi:hypothetical protein
MRSDTETGLRQGPDLIAAATANQQLPLDPGGAYESSSSISIFRRSRSAPFLRHGTAGPREKIGEVLGAIHARGLLPSPTTAPGRGAMMIVDLDSASQARHVTEPR